LPYVKYLKIKLHSKVAALAMLAKYHNLFKRTVASKGLMVVIHRPANAPPSSLEQQPRVVNVRMATGGPCCRKSCFSGRRAMN
jgi:hypothetical protein